MENLSIIDLEGNTKNFTNLSEAIFQAEFLAGLTGPPGTNTVFAQRQSAYWNDMVEKLHTLRKCVINSMHEKSMDFCEDVEVKKRNKCTDAEITPLLLQAYEKEREAADLTIKGEEPTRSILYYSAMCMAREAHCMEKALETAKILLSFTTYDEYKEEAQEIVSKMLHG
jgi:hypothetical protein